MAYYFRVGVLVFILNVQYSGIGYAYPRIFVAFPDGSYLNYDLTVGACFKMSENDWFSWLDGTQVNVNDIDIVREKCNEVGLDWDAFEEFIFQQYEKSIDK